MMPFDKFMILIVLFAIALMLVGVGVLIRWRNHVRAEKALESSPDSKSAPGWVKTLAGAAGKTLTGDAPLTTTQLDAIFVTRDPVSNEWVVDVNGTRYRNLKDIHDDQAARKVLDALSGLQRFAGSIPIVNAPAPIVDPIPTGSRAAVGPTSSALSSPKVSSPKDSLLDQIDAVLQHNLLQQTELSTRVIHVGAAADGSLRIEVDRQFYTTPDEIPEQFIRDIIKLSIQEWERS
jgi:hypothetical protein